MIFLFDLTTTKAAPTRGGVKESIMIPHREFTLGEPVWWLHKGNGFRGEFLRYDDIQEQYYVKTHTGMTSDLRMRREEIYAEDELPRLRAEVEELIDNGRSTLKRIDGVYPFSPS